jgi:hypothetical protein
MEAAMQHCSAANVPALVLQSVARALDSSHDAEQVERYYNQVLVHELTGTVQPVPKATGNSSNKHGRRLNPRKGIPMHIMATYALMRLPERQGNLSDMASKIEENSFFCKQLDWTPRPGTKTYPRCSPSLLLIARIHPSNDWVSRTVCCILGPTKSRAGASKCAACLACARAFGTTWNCTELCHDPCSRVVKTRACRSRPHVQRTLVAAPDDSPVIQVEGCTRRLLQAGALPTPEKDGQEEGGPLHLCTHRSSHP